MRRPSFRQHRNHPESGQASVEFALVVPLLVVILMGVVDFAVGLQHWISETDLARAGARWAAVGQNPSGSGTLQDYLKSQVNSKDLRNGGSNTAQVCVTFPNGRAAGQPVQVKVTSGYRFLPLLKLIPGAASDYQINISSTATMRQEVGPTAANQAAVPAGCV